MVIMYTVFHYYLLNNCMTCGDNLYLPFEVGDCSSVSQWGRGYSGMWRWRGFLGTCCGRIHLQALSSCRGVSGQGPQGQRGSPIGPLAVARLFCQFPLSLVFSVQVGSTLASWKLTFSTASSPFAAGFRGMFSKGLPYSLGEEWAYVGCLLLLGWGPGNTKSRAPSSAG